MTTTKAGARPSQPAPADGKLEQIFQLSKPIEVDGQPIDTITVREPELRHFVSAGRKATNTEQSIELIALVTGVPAAAVAKLKTKDARRIQNWLNALRTPSLIDDDEDFVEHADGRTYTLLTPLFGSPPVHSLTLREPDLESGIAVEKFKTEHEQTAALIAALSGETIPTIMGLKLRDIARVEAWLLPLLDGAA